MRTPGTTKGRAVVRDPEQKRLRALKMLEFRLGQNASYDRVAEQFGVSRKTVERVFDYAKKAGLIVQAEDKILEELVPAAHGALKRALTDTDHKQEAGTLALKVMEGALPGFGKKTAARANAGSHDEDALARAIAEARELYGHVLDGEVVDANQLTLPPAASEAAETGNVGELHQPVDTRSSDGPLGTTPVGVGEREGTGSPAAEEE